MKNILKPFDFLFILASLSAVVFSFLTLRNKNSEKEARLIIDGGGKEFVYPLSENNTFTYNNEEYTVSNIVYTKTGSNYVISIEG